MIVKRSAFFNHNIIIREEILQFSLISFTIDSQIVNHIVIGRSSKFIYFGKGSNGRRKCK